jgi:hypothetical protein
VVAVPPDRPAGASPPTSNRPEDTERDSTVRDLLAEEQATAAAIYGIIVSSAVMASAHGDSALKLAVAVLATLLIYWAAERFAHVMGERIIHAPELTSGRLRSHLSSGWELVSASFLPLGVLLAAGLLGADVDDAVLAALLSATALLVAAGWKVGGEAALSRSSRLVSALLSGAFGAAMILLKSLLH